MISVLVVEDDPVAAQAHREYVTRLPGFEVAGVVHSGGEALRFCERTPVDLVLLDFYLPDGHGLAVCRALRAAGSTADVIAVTSARDLAVVKAAVSSGVVQYLLKPFTFASFREKLDQYARFHRTVGKTGEAADQGDIDRAFATLRTSERPALPKGMSEETLDAIRGALKSASDGLSAERRLLGPGVLVTARRYLEYLADNGIAAREPRYGQVGRPEVWYRTIV